MPRPPPPAAALTSAGMGTPSGTRRAPTSTTSVVGTPACDRRPLGRDLVAEQLDLLGRGPDPDQAGVEPPPGEAGVLGQEPVAGVDGVAARVDGGAAITASARR